MTIDPARERYVNLATFRKDGTEVRTPVWIAADEGVPVVYTNSTSWKVRRIRNNGKVRLAPCNARGDIRGDWVDATARIVDNDAGRDRGIRAFVEKYGWQMRLALFMSRLSGRYHDRTIIELELNNQLDIRRLQVFSDGSDAGSTRSYPSLGAPIGERET